MHVCSQREPFSDWKDGEGVARWGRGSLVVLLLAERAPWEGPRSTRAFEDRPGYP
jgi:hypothetical protein